MISMASSRQLKSKIQSVRNIKQITKAMQMVAATKMRRAQETALQARPYAKNALALLSRLLRQMDGGAVPVLAMKPVHGSGKICLVVVTSDRGLAGSFNNNVLRASWNLKNELERNGKIVHVVAVGKRGKDFFSNRKVVVVGEYTKFSDVVSIHDVAPLAEWLLMSYEEGAYEEVVVCSTQFVSALVQQMEVNKVLPLNIEELQKIVNSIVPKTGKYAEVVDMVPDPDIAEYIFEPGRQQIAEELARELVKVEITHLIYESNASEHSARMIAMKNATENAENMQQELTLALNKARQAAITQEVAEISTAKEALTAE